MENFRPTWTAMGNFSGRSYFSIFNNRLTRAHTHTHTHTHTHKLTHIRTLTYTHKYISTNLQTHNPKNILAHTRTNKQTHTNKQTDKLTHSDTHVLTLNIDTSIILRKERNPYEKSFKNLRLVRDKYLWKKYKPKIKHEKRKKNHKR